MSEKVVIVIPTYNEANVIAQTIAELEKTFTTIDAAKYEMHILIFDSNSPDKTAEIVKQLQSQHPNLHLVTEKQKSGLGSAYIKAITYAIDKLNADIVFEFDADGSHQPKYLKPMMDAFTKGADVVVGSRYVKDGAIPKDWSVDRKILSYGGNLIARLFLTRKYKDFTSGFRGTRTSFLKKIPYQKLLSKNYAYKLHLFWLLHKAKAKIVEYPIEFIERKIGYSKFPKNNVYESLKVVILLRFFELKRYIQVCFVGLGGMIVQLIFFNLLRLIHVPAVLANLLGIEAAIVTTFMLNNIFTFKDYKMTRVHGKKYIAKKFFQFNLCSVGSILIQTGLLALAIASFGKGFWKENITVFIGIIIGSIINYFVYSRWIWKIK
ncbi:MAG: glycosyltransferase family 2 protein [Gammaproteobacteria bacterium]|jgi:dolichol-phosphate mannosyltransferase